MNMKFIERYPNDTDTQMKLLNELDNYLENLTPEKIFTPRFTFLLQYFKLNGVGELQEMCINWLNKIHNVHDIRREG